MKSIFELINDLAKQKDILNKVPELKKGFVIVNLWISQSKSDVGHASIEVYRVNTVKNITEHTYLGLWPNSDEELDITYYSNSVLRFAKSMLFGIKGRVANISLESLGAADFVTMWDKKNSTLAKRYGVLPTYSFKFVMLDVDAIFNEIEDIKQKEKNKISNCKYSPIASSAINFCNIFRIDNCLTAVENLLAKGGFKKLLYNQYDWLSPIAAMFGVLIHNNNKSLDNKKFIGYLALYWAISRATLGAISGMRNALISNTNPYIGGGLLSGLGLFCFGGISGAITYTFPTQPLSRKGSYFIKTPENFLEELIYAQQTEYEKYPILKGYNTDCDNMIKSQIPLTDHRTRYLTIAYSYLLLSASTAGKSATPPSNDGFDEFLQYYDNLDPKILDKIENDFENDTIQILNAKKQKLQVKQADPTTPPDIKVTIGKHIQEIDKEITASQRRLKP